MELLFEHLNKILTIVFLIFAGLLIRTSLLLIGQTWVRAYHHTGTFLLLPPIAYVISTIIAGNIADGTKDNISLILSLNISTT